MPSVAWPEESHGRSDGMWLTLAKKGKTEPTSLRYVEAVEEARGACFGWVDGRAAAPTTPSRSSASLPGAP